MGRDSNMLEVCHLSYRVGNREILHDVSFQVKEGSMTCIVGPNGCGKSTLLSYISGRLKSRGSVFYKGKALESYDRKAYARETAVMVQQSMEMTGELRAEQVVLMGRYPFKSRFGDYQKKDHEIVRRVMKETGSLSLWGQEMKSMSGGEKQRVLIAKALAQEPQLLLMDEPTNHLDVKYKIALMETLKQFHQQGTILIVLHDLNLACRYCDHAIVMNKGHIVDQGTADEVLTESKLENIFEVPFYTAFHNEQRFIYY